MRRAVIGLILLSAAAAHGQSCACGGSMGGPAVAPTGGGGTPTAQSMAVTGPATVAQGGGTGQYRAIVTNTDGSTTDVTSSATWQVLENQVASVSGGTITSKTLPGQFQVRASYQTYTATATASVPAATIVNVPNGSTGAQINTIVANAPAGSEILFAPGTYNVTGSPCCGIIAKTGVTYMGPAAHTAIISGSGGYGGLTLALNTTPTVIQNLVFDNADIYIDGNSSNVNIEYNEIRNVQYPSGNSNSNPTNGIWVAGVIQNSDVSYNNMHDLDSSALDQYTDANTNAAGMVINQGSVNLTVEYNTLTNVNEGFHTFYDTSSQSTASANTKFLYNTFTRAHRIAIEQQTIGSNSVSGLEIGYNNISNARTPWALTYCISQATGSSSGTNVHDNTCNANIAIAAACSGTGCHYGYGIETYGSQTVVNHNLVEGPWSTAIGWDRTPDNITLSNNSFCGPITPFVTFENNVPSESNNLTQINNTTSSASTCSFQ